ncbi:unnamed protein product [Scytosiphon promiscuus]
MDQAGEVYEKKRASSRDGGGPGMQDAESLFGISAPAVPPEALHTVFEFLDGNGLLSCEAVSYLWRCKTDRTDLWKRACTSAFPHLGDYCFESPYACCSAYEGDWREAFLDGNRENRSTVLDWKIEAGVGADGDAAEDEDSQGSKRRHLPPFSLCGYSFRLLADPAGNPRASNSTQAEGAPVIEKGLSVYLKVAFPDDWEDTPPWSGGGTVPDGFPPPPLPVGPGHPWGAGEEQEEEPEGPNGEQEEVGSQEEGVPADGGGGDSAIRVTKSGAVGSATAAAAPAATMVRRDPHGLRRRRRRFRTREGRLPVVSHVGEASAIERECCAAFSLTAVNTAGRNDVMWVSSMQGDRFWLGRSSWGVHCLVPSSKFQDTQEGFLKDGMFTVRLRVRLLYLMAHVYTTADLASHRGFGVVPVRGNDRPFHFHGERGAKRQGRDHTRSETPSGVSTGGPLPCHGTFEILRCTTLEEMKSLVARSLKVSPDDVRLWAITQPLTDGPLAPRQLLSGEVLPSYHFDDGQDSPSLFSLLRGDAVDETNRVRLWVERRGDGGFWETETTQTTQTSPSQHRQEHQEREEEEEGDEEDEALDAPLVSSPGDGGGSGDVGRRRTASPTPSQRTPKRDYAGVRLSHTKDASGWMQQSTLAWGSWYGSGSTTNTDSTANPEPAGGATAVEERILVFIKGLGLGGGGGEGVEATAAAAVDPPTYLTHAVLREKNPLRCLFELAAELLTDGTAPEDLEAYIEDLPWAWQSAALRHQAAESTERVDGAVTAAEGRLPRSSPPGGGVPNGRHSASCRRFLVCPPAFPVEPSSSAKSRNQGVHAGGRRDEGQSPAALTLKEAGLSSGASICFYRSGREACVRRTYGALVEELVESMRMLLRREGPLGRVHHIKLAEVVEICEALGYQGFRARIAHEQQRHINPRETLEYVAMGRHLAFICDSCGTQDFSGPRYHCRTCPDYDLCQKCRSKREPAPRHRYLFTQGHWKREGGFHGHSDDHELEEMFTVPADGREWRKRLLQQQQQHCSSW